MKRFQSILFCLLTLGCTNSMQVTSTESNDRIADQFDRQGHRGCRGLMPENTIPAMIMALELGVTTLELDVVITKDLKVILSHEPFFNHEITTKPDGTFIEENEERKFNIYQMNYEEVQKYDVGKKPHPRFPQQQKISAAKPLLSELIDSVDQYVLRTGRDYPFFNIETKCLPFTDNIYHPQPPEFVELIMQVIKSKRLEDKVIIQSFDFRTLKYMNEHYPSVRTAVLIEGSDKRSLNEHMRELGFTPDIYSPEHRLVSKRLIDQCHQRKIQVIPWTVNNKERIDTLVTMGIDGVISDYPNIFLEKGF